MTKTFFICTIKPWNIEAFHRRTPRLLGNWYLINRPEDLTIDVLRRVGPRYVFFPHWSWRVPKEIISDFECICFHMSDVPYGRGGSPLQNLILRGHKFTKLTALRMTEEFDAGPVYVKQQMSLDGRAEEIFMRAADMVYDIIAEIIENNPAPQPQVGTPVVFRRRTPEESRLPSKASLDFLYDFIRMLDAPTYPKAFIELGDLRLEFDHAHLSTAGVLEARVKIQRTIAPCKV